MDEKSNGLRKALMIFLKERSEMGARIYMFQRREFYREFFSMT